MTEKEIILRLITFSNYSIFVTTFDPIFRISAHVEREVHLDAREQDRHHELRTRQADLRPRQQDRDGDCQTACHVRAVQERHHEIRCRLLFFNCCFS